SIRRKILDEFKKNPTKANLNLNDDTNSDDDGTDINSAESEVDHDSDNSDKEKKMENDFCSNNDKNEDTFLSNDLCDKYCTNEDKLPQSSNCNEDGNRTTYYPYLEKFEEDYISPKCGATIADWAENFQYSGEYYLNNLTVVDPETHKIEKKLVAYCGYPRKVKKSEFVHGVPTVCILNLDQAGPTIDKIPEKLKIGNNMYTLRGLTVHRGAASYRTQERYATNQNVMLGGHFTSLLRIDNTYYEYDDIGCTLKKFKSTQRGTQYESAIYAL
ncbi:unnamed protein product, partial [Didymodactylos carnosus]